MSRRPSDQYPLSAVSGRYSVLADTKNHICNIGISNMLENLIMLRLYLIFSISETELNYNAVKLFFQVLSDTHHCLNWLISSVPN